MALSWTLCGGRRGRECLHHLHAGHRGCPVLLDVLNHEFCARCMRNKRPGRRLVHSIRKVANKNTVNSPARHLANSKSAIENAHIGVHPHVEDRVNPMLPKDVVYLRSTIGDDVAGCDGEQRRLAAPGTVLGIARSIAAAIAIVDRQREIVQWSRFWRIGMGRALGELSPAKVPSAGQSGPRAPSHPGTNVCPTYR